MALDSKDVERVKQIESALGCHRGWNSPDAYFSHSGGKVTLGQARGVWRLAKELIEIAKKEFPPKAKDEKKSA